MLRLTPTLKIVLLQLCFVASCRADLLVSAVGIKNQQPVFYAATSSEFVSLNTTGSVATYSGNAQNVYYFINDVGAVDHIDGSNGTTIKTTQHHTTNATCMAYDRTSEHLVVATHDQVVVLDPKNSGTPVSSFPGLSDVYQCAVNPVTHEFWLLRRTEPNTFRIVNYLSGDTREVSVTPKPLSVDFFAAGVFFLSNSDKADPEWGGTSVLNILDPKSGETVQALNYTFPEEGSVPTPSANAIVPLDAAHPEHVEFVSVLWDNTNNFVCVGTMTYVDGKLKNSGGKFAEFGVERPGELTVLAIAAMHGLN